MEKADRKPKTGMLRVLILEDEPADAELIQRALRRAGISFNARVTKSRREFSSALARFQPQVILADFKLPGFNGMAALDLARARAPEIPFIFVSGAISEHKAIASLSQGAADYIFKNNLSRLGPAVRRVLAEAETRRQKSDAEKSLRESEEKYRTLVAESPDGIFIADLQGNFISVNPAMCSGLGYNETELLAMKIWDIVPERYRSQHEQRLAALLEGKARNEAAEYLVRTRDGRERFVAILSAPYYKDRTLAGFLGIARDITEKMEMETRLRASEEFHRTLIETSPDAIVTVDGGGRITFASHKALDLFAVPGGSDVLGVSVLDYVDPADATRVRDRLVEILSGSSLPEIREYRLRRWDKRPFWAEITSAPLHDNAGRNTGLLLVCRDVSERRRIEIALRESEAKYRLIAENTVETISLLDLSLRFTYVSPSILKLRGYTAEESLNQDLGQVLTPESLARIQQIFAEEMAFEVSGGADPQRSRSLELEEYHKDGSIVWVENSISFLRNPQGNAISFLMVSKDISERKQAEIALRRSEEKFRKIFEEHAAVKLLLDPVSGAIIDANQAAENFYGWTREELKRMTIGQINTLTPEKLQAELKRAREEGRVFFQFRHRLADGSIRDVEVFSSRIQIEGSDFLHSIIHDISDRKRAETALRHNENLLSKIFDILPIGLWLADASGRLMRSNETGRRIWGAEPMVGPEEYGVFKARRLPGAEEIAPEDWALAHTIRDKATVTDEMLEIDAFDGKKKVILNYTAPVLDETGRLEAAVIVNLDITARQQAEELLRASLHEKEVLLQEIHHRVKNNLQIVSSLLTLQAGHAATKSVEEMFRESQDRIRSIALVHESLYKSHNLAEITFDDYLRVLVDNLVNSHFAAAGRVAVQYQMERILLTIETAIPLGLIVNELVSNSLKHAFPGGRHGQIRVQLHGRDKERFVGVKTKSGTLYRVPTCELTVADDGVGLPAGFELAKQESLGMQILSMLARQLNGELTVRGGPGTEWRMIIPAHPLKAKAHEAKT
ncbi:MAG: PAS domain S-box protein [Candidatus Aminicenantes bacterium]|nr:PAS domain S-box protein [Candidatus Aminicenantes bacterium]